MGTTGKIAAALLVLSGSSASAQPQPATMNAAQEADQSCGVGRAGALAEIGCELNRALLRAPAGALVVAAPVVSDAKLAAPERFGARIASLVAGAVGRGARAVDEPARLARARTLASRAGTLIHLQTEIARGELQVTADVYPAPRKFWARVRDSQPSPTIHAFVSRRIDPEIRSFLPPVQLVAKNVVKAATPDADPVAIACGDADGDGALEIVWVGRRKIHIGRVRKGSFVPSVSASWSELSPIAQSPLREPLGSVVIEPGRFIDVGISDRAYELRLSPALTALGKPGRRVPWPGGGCTRFNALVLRAEIEPCQPNDPPPQLGRFDAATDAVAGARVVGKNGRARLVRAGRLASGPTAVLVDDRGRRARISGIGAQLAIGDLDGDGQPELVSGSDTLDPAADALVVHTWQDDGKLVERLRIGVPSGVRAVAICPPESAGQAPIAIATGDGVWIVR